jgi:hypothetical protein
MQGICPECGLQFPWHNVFRREYWRLDGFVEHAWGLRRYITWSFRTAWWALWPWNFYRRVEMHQRLRMRGWVAWILVMLWLPRMLLLVIPDLYNALMGTQFFGYYPYYGLDSSEFGMHLLGLRYERYGFYLGGGAWFLPGLGWGKAQVVSAIALMAWPVSLAAVPISLRAARVRPRLVMRSAVYSLITYIGVFWLRTLIGVVGWMGASLIGGTAPAYGRPTSDLLAAWYSWIGGIMHFVSYDGWVVLPWLSLWWLVTLTKGFKLRKGVFAWLAVLIVVHVAIIVIMGGDVTVNGHVYRY